MWHVFLIGMWAMACRGNPTPVSDVPRPTTQVFTGLDRDELWSLITTGSPTGTQPTGKLPADPAYAGWELMPTFTGYQDFRLKPLDLPTHGRFVTVYVNDIAKIYLDAYLVRVEDGGGTVPEAELPVGSILVKANHEHDDDLEPLPLPAVLTVAYKPSADFCGSDERVGGACVGGAWLWAFYGLDQTVEVDGKPVVLSRAEAFDRNVEDQTTSFCVNCHDPGVRTDFLRGLQGIARKKAAEVSPTRDPAKAPTPGPDHQLCDNILLGSSLPDDVPVDPASIADPGERQRMFDCFSWQSFVALNWPASQTERGEPSPTAKSMTDAPGADRVWETYSATWEVFQPEKASWDPTALDWNAERQTPVACQGRADTPLPVVAMVSKSGSSSDVANETGQAFAGSFGTLTDRNGELVRYQVLFDRTEFEHLLPTAITAGLTPAGPNQGEGVRMPDGVTEVKASWKVLCQDAGCTPLDPPDAHNTYYTRDVLAYDAHGGGPDTPTCAPAKLGLVGLHIARKTFWAPQWVWSTFEHRLNVPATGTEGPQSEGFSFYDPTCAVAPKVGSPFQTCAAQPFLAPAVLADPCCTNAELNRFPTEGFGVPPRTADNPVQPNQLTRLAPVGPTELNAAYGEALKGSVWQNYFLVDTQWPMNGRAPEVDGLRPVNTQLCRDQWGLQHDPTITPTPDRGCYTMVPNVLRNTSMESYMATYIVGETGPRQVSNRSCMGCHSAGTDFSFIWLDGVEQVVPIP